MIVGRTGKHLFLTDNDDGKPPLLLRMVDDCDDIKFRFDFLIQPFVFINLEGLSKNSDQYNIAFGFSCRSALRSFRRRVAYANANFDRILSCSFVTLFFYISWALAHEYLTSSKDMVGWRTSSIRRQRELPKVLL